MKITMPRFRSIRKDIRAVSPAVSLVIITAATVVLVLVSGNYALQVLERQQAASEFDTVQKSLITFDDAVRDIAFDRGGSRSVAFTTKYGTLSLLPNNELIDIDMSIGSDSASYSLPVATVKYALPSTLVTFGDGYQDYVLGSEVCVVSSAVDGVGRILAEQQSGFLSLALDYRVRVTEEGPAVAISGDLVTYVDIIVINMTTTTAQHLNANYDLVAKNVGIILILKPIIYNLKIGKYKKSLLELFCQPVISKR